MDGLTNTLDIDEEGIKKETKSAEKNPEWSPERQKTEKFKRARKRQRIERQELTEV